MNLNNSAIKTFDILQLISTEIRELTVTEISEALGFPKSTTFQILQTLVHLKILETNRVKTYRLGIRFFEIVLPALDQMELRREARYTMEDLSARFKETVVMATYDESEIVYFEKVEGPTPFRLSVPLGAREPMHSVALGKAILAALPDSEVRKILRKNRTAAVAEGSPKSSEEMETDLREARSRGYAVDDREYQPDITCVAAPICDATGGPIGAITVASQASRMGDDRITEIGRYLGKAVLQLSRKMGFKGNHLYAEVGGRG